MPKTKILVVDDDSELREAVTEQLSMHEEFEVTAVGSGREGVQAAKVGRIDLVIMDVGLPDIDGHDAVRILRKNGFKAPIIMLTGHNTDSDTILGLESLRDQAVSLCRATSTHSRPASPARGERRCHLHDRPIHVPASLEALRQPEGQKGPPDR